MSDQSSIALEVTVVNRVIPDDGGIQPHVGFC